MIDHVWTILCSDVIIDQRSKNVSIHNAIEQITIRDVPKPEGVLNASMELISLWSRSKLDTPTIGQERVSVISPSEHILLSHDQEINLSEYPRARNILHFFNFPVQEPGRYNLKVELRLEGQDEWRSVAMVPLNIKFEPPKKKTSKQEEINEVIETS